MKYIICVLTFSLMTSPLFADRGIVYVEDVNLAEPAQRAIVAHNGTWELLILQTDLEGKQPGKAVEFMPLPSNPEVSLVPDSCFKNLQTLIDKYKMQYGEEYKLASDEQQAEPEAIKIVAEHELGPHNITVVEIKDVNHFQSWVKDFFERKSLGKPVLTDELKKTVEDYAKRGFRFLAFDVVTVPAGRKTVAPLAYYFKCDYVYYPLKVTNLYGGTGTIEVFYIFNLHDPNDDNIPHPYFSRHGEDFKNWLSSETTHISTSELESLYPKTKDMFSQSGANLFATKYKGKLYFDNDIWLRIAHDRSEWDCMQFLSLLQAGRELPLLSLLPADRQLPQAFDLLAQVPFGLNRQKIESLPQLRRSIKNICRKEDIDNFKTIKHASWTGGYENQFDKEFIASYLSNKQWKHWYFESDTKRLHFFVVRENYNDFHVYRVVYFRIEERNEHS